MEKIEKSCYLRAPKELEAHILRIRSTDGYYRHTKYERLTPPELRDRIIFIFLSDPSVTENPPGPLPVDYCWSTHTRWTNQQAGWQNRFSGRTKETTDTVTIPTSDSATTPPIGSKVCPLCFPFERFTSKRYNVRQP